MKKQKRSPRTQTRKAKHDNRIEAEAQADQGRRRFLRLTRNAVIGAALVGGSGYVFAQNVLSARHEHDLTRVGNGKPTIVQIHDPGCPKCRSLQRSTRTALAEMEDGAVQYLVANIKAPEGRQFADAHGVGHVTLLLFDGKGRRRDVIRGEQHSDYLLQIFQRLSATRS